MTPLRKPPAFRNTPYRNTRQQTLEPFIKTEPLENLPLKAKPPQGSPEKQLVSISAYKSQQAQVRGAEAHLEKFRNMLAQLDLEYLPDKGETIKNSVR